MKTPSVVIGLVVLWLSVMATPAKDIGIFVNGGYGEGETELNDLVRERIDDAREVFDRRHPPPNGESHRADSRDDLETQLRALNCGAGDNITIALMGHGTKNRFVFSLEKNSTKRVLTPEQLCTWISAAAKDPGCCVRVVIFACHSGSWIEGLSACPNVKAVYASCRANEKSYSDIFFPQTGAPQDNGDWLKGFTEDWDDAPAGIDPGDALDAATESAWEKMPVTQSGKQHPTGWRKGELMVRAHVEQAFGTNSPRAKLHFWDPVFMRCKVQEVSIDRAAIQVGQNYKACDWITFKATFDAAGPDGRPRGPLPMTGAPTPTDSPTVRMAAHVVGVDSKRKFIRVHTIEPNWMYCKERDLKLPAGTVLDRDLRQCNWIEEQVKVIDPDGAVELTDGQIAASDVTVPVLAHVEGTRPRDRSGQLCLKIQEPSFLATGQNYYVPIPLNQLRAYRECEHVRVTLHLNTLADGVYRGDDIIKLDQRRFQQSEYDVAVDGVGGLESTVELGVPVVPVVRLRNAGRVIPAPTPVTVVVRDIEQQIVFQETANPVSLAVGEGLDVAFPAWPATAPGPYRAVITVSLPDDLNPENNTLVLDFVVPPPTSTGAGPDWQTFVIGGEPLPPVMTEEQSVRLTGVGRAPSGNADQLSFAFQRASTDFNVACVLVPGQVQPGHSAGLMFRLGPDPQAPFAAVFLDVPQVRFAARPAPGAPVNAFESKPVSGSRIWIGLGRRANRAIAQYSQDGWNWATFGEFEFPQNLPTNSLVGLMASAPMPTVFRFDDVSGFPLPGPPTPRPAELRAFPSGPGSITLQWRSDAKTHLGYVIARAEPDQPFQVLTVVAPSETDFTDRSLPPATEFAYRVQCLGYYESEAWTAVATAETPGDGLEAWAESEGISDPFTLVNGVLPASRYAIGDGPTWIFSPGEPPRIQFERRPGVQDVLIDWQTSSDLREWFTLRALGAQDPSGPYELVEPVLQDHAYFRLAFRPNPAAR